MNTEMDKRFSEITLRTYGGYMVNKDLLLPNYDDGRIFISPVLGCIGGCKYCYLEIQNYFLPRENMITFDDIMNFIEQCDIFEYGKCGTIISIGAWGDIFPPNSTYLRNKSIDLICKILHIGNPVQIMSKFSIDNDTVNIICKAQIYQNQLLYSTTITTINYWKIFEQNTSSPIERMETCKKFSSYGVITNVLLKPFLLGITDLELDTISKVIVSNGIKYCVVGILYWDEKIEKKLYSIRTHSFDPIINSDNNTTSHLDCNGKIQLNATDVLSLKKYVNLLRKNGINAFLKSSCVNSNIQHTKNPSKYFEMNSDYCLKCGNCASVDDLI